MDIQVIAKASMDQVSYTAINVKKNAIFRNIFVQNKQQSLATIAIRLQY